MDSLYAFYHQQRFCYRKMLNHYKFCNALFNGLALLLLAAGIIAGPILENSTLVACLAAVVTVVKGWNDFKQFCFKVAMSRFAFTTYAKALTDLRRPRRTKRRQRPQQGSGWLQDLKRHTRQGYKESRNLIKQNKALQRLLMNRW